jgi:dTDP-4-dehydrorhamnose 3,5-epimerase
VEIRELKIPDSYEIVPRLFEDGRGAFLESYRADRLAEAVGHPLALSQSNTSISKRGVVRGIHFADVPPSQAKYVTAMRGAVIDYIVDIRAGSPTFGEWDSVILDDVDRRSVYIAEGLGHCFVALTDDATVHYLVSAPFNAEREHGINPLDPEVGLAIPPGAGEPILSPKDLEAPTLAQALEAGRLPRWDACRSYYAELNERGH